jgi:hypothetical protein
LAQKLLLFEGEWLSGGNGMCDHHGGLAGTGSVPGAIDRRAFLQSGAAGAIAIGLPLGVLGGAPSAQGAATFKGTHGSVSATAPSSSPTLASWARNTG